MRSRWRVNAVLVAAAMWLLMPFCSAQTTIAGDWQGAIPLGSGGQLHVVLHIRSEADGGLSATMVSVDQGPDDIPASTVTFKDSKLSLTFDTLHASYAGVVNPDLTQIKGDWTQGDTIPLAFTRMTASALSQAKPAAPSDIDGAWIGTLDLGAMKLRVVFHIVNTAGGLTATMDSPDQGAKGIPVNEVTRKDDVLKLEIKPVHGVFEGTIAKDKSAITGTWTQGTNSLPLVLKPMKDQSEMAPPRRPQNPVKPYPYREVELTYENKAQGDTLAATLTIPQGKGPFPGVLLIVGSGPHDRDESLLGHKPFLVLADYLTRRGIAVLRADDRGVGKSTGDFSTATTADLATDVEAGLAYLKTRPEVDPHRIGLLGHSEGGVIAPMVAARNPDVAFLVMMAGTGVTGEQILVEQNVLIEEANGVSAEMAEADAAKKDVAFALVVQEKDKDRATLQKDLHAKLDGNGQSVATLNTEIEQLTSPWFRYFLAYDPAPALRQVKCPVLVLSGEKDLQVPPSQNLPAIRTALQNGGNAHFEVEELPGLNHLFQTAKTGALSEYVSIEETISPVALQKIADWILKQQLAAN